MSKPTFRDIVRSLTQKTMAVNMLLGFSAGVPFLLASRTLQAWFSYTGGTNALVGAIAVISLPYTLKFIWAPIMDRYELPFLGRRRGWLLVTQLGLFAVIAALSRVEPMANVKLTLALAFLVAFFGASQDIVVDAYRRESLKDEELGLGTSVYSLGYRTAMWITGGAALILAQHLSWNSTYFIMATMMGLGILATFWADEPEASPERPRSMNEAIILPLKDFFTRKGAWLMLLFVLLYKVGDSYAGNMLSKFYADLQFTPEEVGVIAKTMGPFAVVAGTFFGGGLMMRLGIYRSLFIFGIFQALSTLSFVLLDHLGHNLIGLTGVVFFEDFSAGMGSAAFAAFMMSLTNRAFTATQYALLTSLMNVPRTMVAATAGYVVDFLGWSGFFTFCAAIALPGLLLLTYLYRQQNKETSSVGVQAHV